MAVKYKLLGYVLWREACDRLESKRVRAPPERQTKEGPCEEDTLKPTLQYGRAGHERAQVRPSKERAEQGPSKELSENGG